MTVAAFSSLHNTLSFLIGSGILILNLGLLAGGMGLIFKKKLIALAIFLIVIKYAISGIIIYHVIRESLADPMWIAVGISSFVATILVYMQRKYVV